MSPDVPPGGPPARLSSPRPRPGNVCQKCGREVPSRHVVFQQNIGMLVRRVHRTVSGYLCPPCVRSAFWSMTLPTLFFGWFGMISFFVTPVFLLSNVYQYAQASPRGYLVIGSAALVAAAIGSGIYFLATHEAIWHPGYYDPNAYKLKTPPPPPVPIPPPRAKSPEEIRRDGLAAAEESVLRLEKSKDGDAAVLSRRLLELAKVGPSSSIIVWCDGSCMVIDPSKPDRGITAIGDALSQDRMNAIEKEAVGQFETAIARAWGAPLLRCEGGAVPTGSPGILIQYTILPAPELKDDPVFRSMAGSIAEIKRLQPFQIEFTVKFQIQGRPAPEAELTLRGRPRVMARPPMPFGGSRPIGYEYTQRAKWAFEDFFTNLELRLRGK